jgi:hypothetical protein
MAIKGKNMSSEKQILANQQNALLSTGPKTFEGKVIVATNAVKHGIFTKDLLVSTKLGKEDEGEYLEMLHNLELCLAPQNQMESLLVEKIAVDFWRLRRVMRFEAGSIEKHLETIFKDFYSYGKSDNDEIDAEILMKKEQIDWNATYINYLKNEKVSFDQPQWETEDLESDISEDFCLIIQSVEDIPNSEKKNLLNADTFTDLRKALFRYGYGSKKEISEKLIEIYDEQIQKFKTNIESLEQTRLKNIESDKLNRKIGAIPHSDHVDKTLKYERSIQKSIFQNLFLLKKLQGTF